ncbi:MAG: hypothetical protein KDK65_06720, partial [Chlamydiia bacterium]|nr:hypothetical protein [Chlamydiia bacterium]
IYLLPPFSIESLQDLLKRFLHLQYFLKNDLNQTGMQLLQKIHPLIHAQLNSKSDAPYERFSQVAQPTLEQHDSGWYQMKETGTDFVRRCFDRCAHVLHHHQQWDQSFDEARSFCETYVPKITATKTQQQRVINSETVSATPEEWVRILTGFQDQVLPLNLSSLSAPALKSLCEQLKSVPLKKLNFAGTTELTPDLLLPLLSHHLEELDLTGCTKLPEAIFADIAKNCPKLERLIARNFSIKAFGQRRRPLQFPNLQLLIIDNANLTEVHLNAPHIQFVTLNAPQLNKLTLLCNQKSLHLMTHSSVQPKLLAKKQLTDYSTTDGTQFTTTKTKSPFTLQWN